MTLPPEYFTQRWAADDDPWRIADRWYERRKRDLLLAALPAPRYGAALEVGCAAGHLTSRLAARCDRLLACDGAERAVELTRARTAAEPGVTVQRCWVPGQWPGGTVDLVVLSEVGYYLDDADLALLAERAAGSLAPGGTLAAVHWRHEAPGYPSTAEQVHDALAGVGLPRAVRHEEPDLLLDVWVRGEPSVARAEGWLR